MGEVWVYMNGHIMARVISDVKSASCTDLSRYLHPIEKVQRLAQYEQYFQAILAEGRHDHPDHDELTRAKAKAKQALKRGQEESDLERIQDLFPNDFLRLYDKDVLTMKMKGLIRKRSTTAARLQRALSAKAARPAGEETTGLPRQGQEKRHFLLESPVQFTTGVQSQERHLFLFNDLLLVAKARSGGNFKLKDKVRVSELWLTRCAIDDVIEVNKSLETSFVLGWPTTNVVATFSTQATRDLWWSKLNEVVVAEREKEPRSTNIQVVYYDPATSIEYCKTFAVGPDDTARCCIRLALQHLEMRGRDPAEFQLWAKTARDESPYPLIGHERPFAIRLSCLREGLSAEEGFDLDHCNNVHGPDPLARCQFVLRSKRKSSNGVNGDCLSEEKKNNKKGRIRIRQVFRRSSSKGEDCFSGALFGVPLARLCEGDTPPKPVMAMLQQLHAKGPFTQGIFRKSANARLVRELRDKLDAGEEVALDVVPVLATAALLKDFLRSLPDPLLGGALYPLWTEAVSCTDERERLGRIRSVLDQLPAPNACLLHHFLCVLHHVARRSSQNLMSAANLGVCVGPSLLWSAPVTLCSRAVPTLVELLVSRAELLCGSHVPHLLGDPPERDPTRQDSGAEESDSLHSGGLRRDDSSIDSLERELMEPCPPPRKDKMSLSRDSGLTMSDSQLYTPDEEESGSTSSGSGRALYPPAQPDCYDTLPHSKVTSSYSVPAAASTPNNAATTATTPPTREYVRVYGGWEERVQECCRTDESSIYARPLGVINPNFQRQDWFRQRSHLKRLNSGGGGGSGSSSKSGHGSSSGSASSGVGGLHYGMIVRRSASEESLLDGCEDEDGGLMKRPALHRKGRAPAPPPVAGTKQPVIEQREGAYSCYAPGTPITRSKSAHHLEATPIRHQEPMTPEESTRPQQQHRKATRTTAEDWGRSQSTPHIASLEEVDRSYDSSTLSDDDSTPHVSRSNSRGKDCAAANSAWESAYGGGSQSELLVRAAPVSILEDDETPPSKPTRATSASAPPLPPKRASSDVKLRHLPPVHVDTPTARPEWEVGEPQAPRRGRSRHRDGTIRVSQRSKSLPPPPGENQECTEERTGDFQGEISWSVSKLRTLFSNGGVRPPPYRPPPSVIPSYRAPITSYHLGKSSQSERYVTSRRLLLEPGPRLRVDSTDEEESYV